jgi:hypothetical protein
MNLTDKELQMIEDGLVELWDNNHPFIGFLSFSVYSSHKKQEIEDLSQRITDERIRMAVASRAAKAEVI